MTYLEGLRDAIKRLHGCESQHQCGTYYRLHHLCSEFLLCSPGSYDEYRLERLTNEAAAEEVTPDGADSSRGTE